MNNSNTSKSHGGFSLLELLIVMTIIVVMSSLMGPTLSTVIRGTNLTQGADKVIGILSIARQTAVTRAQTVEVRFYCYTNQEVPADNGQCHALQAFAINDSGNATPIMKVQTLPQTVVISTNSAWSTLFTQPVNTTIATNGMPSIPKVGTAYTFYAFQYGRSGTTSLARNANQTNWCVSVVNAHDVMGGASTYPANFTTIVIDPYNGSLKVYHPSL